MPEGDKGAYNGSDRQTYTNAHLVYCNVLVIGKSGHTIRVYGATNIINYLKEFSESCRDRQSDGRNVSKYIIFYCCL